MHKSLQNLRFVENKVNELIDKKQLKISPKIIVISKTFSLEKMKPLLETNHCHFGENKIQEAENKWSKIKITKSNLQLHFVGKLQSNKAKRAVVLFDYIHSLDNKKLALKIFQYEKELDKKIKLFIQVNVGKEDQKTGIAPEELNNFYNYCSKELSLNIIGLMCLPPINSNSDKYFKILKLYANKLNLKELSMGMSSDFEDAILNGSTFLRLGTAILGEKNLS